MTSSHLRLYNVNLPRNKTWLQFSTFSVLLTACQSEYVDQQLIIYFMFGTMKWFKKKEEPLLSHPHTSTYESTNPTCKCGRVGWILGLLFGVCPSHRDYMKNNHC